MKCNAYFSTMKRNAIAIAQWPSLAKPNQTITTSTNIYCFLILNVMVELYPPKLPQILNENTFISRSRSFASTCRSSLPAAPLSLALSSAPFPRFFYSCAFLMSLYLHFLMLIHSYSMLSAFIIHLQRNSCSQRTAVSLCGTRGSSLWQRICMHSAAHANHLLCVPSVECRQCV